MKLATLLLFSYLMIINSKLSKELNTTLELMSWLGENRGNAPNIGKVKVIF